MKRALTTAAFCLLLGACSTTSNQAPVETRELWRPLNQRIGWWINERPNSAIIAAMMNEGLMFIAFYSCPDGSLHDHGQAVWFAGDTFARQAADCQGKPVNADVSFHLSRQFVESLPVLAQAQYFTTIGRPRPR